LGEGGWGGLKTAIPLKKMAKYYNISKRNSPNTALLENQVQTDTTPKPIL